MPVVLGSVHCCLRPLQQVKSCVVVGLSLVQHGMNVHKASTACGVLEGGAAEWSAGSVSMTLGGKVYTSTQLSVFLMLTGVRCFGAVSPQQKTPSLKGAFVQKLQGKIDR